MKEQDVVEMLRHYRHDWLNDLQLILGYTQLGHLNKIEKKINEIMDRSSQERSLDRLNIPKTMVWLYQLNWRSPSFQLQFRSFVSDEGIIIDDQSLLTRLQKLFQIFPAYQQEYQEYQGILCFKNEQHTIHIQLIFDLNWEHMDQLVEELRDLSFVKQVATEDNLRIEWQE
ncbi:Spo0B domain-containing protein [Gracilibacillus alcaliphilus]|uniref:Spo0B domain-containing protein n=1 Tax=Gracilibacillus alcaliphilus TaxID=1401441 RepID=UPI00195A0D29|nr:Spo0B domain-containing protein [Gracilibacillus alcaliphilus]MBM7678567.1 stage 0 sporulation protein B (sporulation initiation phosphotransferase) [Gracilibacillus alcaliphilus]